MKDSSAALILVKSAKLSLAARYFNLINSNIYVRF